MEPMNFEQLPDGRTLIWGGVAVREVNDRLDLGLPENPHDRLGGYVFGALNRIGRIGDVVEFDGGRILNPSFSRYRVPRITDTPALDVTLVGDPDTPSTGAGEPAIVTVAAGIANAVMSATGRQVDTLPITPQL